MSGVVNERAREGRVARAGKTAPTAKMRGRLILDAALCVLLIVLAIVLAVKGAKTLVRLHKEKKAPAAQ